MFYFLDDITVPEHVILNFFESLEHVNKSDTISTYVHRNHPHLIGHGTHSVTFALPGSELVAKVYGFHDSTQIPSIPEDVIQLEFATPSSFRLDFGVELTQYWLQYMNIPGLELPKMRTESYTLQSLFPKYQPKFSSDETLRTITFMPDLRIGGYTILDPNPTTFKTLSNGEALQEQYTTMVTAIISACAELHLTIYPHGHGSKDNPQQAIKHMFFIQKDSQNIGKLVAGDRDHLFIDRTDCNQIHTSSEYKELVQQRASYMPR